MRGSGKTHLQAPDRAADALAYPPVLCGRLHRLWRALARRAALYGQGGNAWHRAGQRASAALAGAVPAALDRGLEDQAHGGRQHRPVRSLRRKQQDRRPHIYAGLIPSECGGRDKATCERLLERLTRWRTRLYCADDYVVYDVLLPVGQLHAGKEETHGLERDNARQRHWLARFRRRSIVVSKAKRMVDVSIALFARFAGNDRIGDPISMLA